MIDWIPIENYRHTPGRVLVFSPVYAETDPMRYRVIDAHFLGICTNVTHYCPLTSPEPLSAPISEKETHIRGQKNNASQEEK